MFNSFLNNIKGGMGNLLSQYAPSLGSWFGGSSESPYASSLSSMMGQLKQNLPAPVPKAPEISSTSYAPTSSSSINPMQLLQGAESLKSYAPSPYSPSTLWNNASQRMNNASEYGKNSLSSMINTGIRSLIPQDYANTSVSGIPQLASHMGAQYGSEYGASQVPSFMQGTGQSMGSGIGSYVGQHIGNLAANKLSQYLPEDMQKVPVNRIGRPLVDYMSQYAPYAASSAMSGLGNFAGDMGNWGLSKATGIPNPIVKRLTPYIPQAAKYGFNALRGLSDYMPSMSQLMSRGDEQFD